MRIARIAAIVTSCAALMIVLGGCPKHENFPTELDVIVPPTPTNFEITASGTDYTFTWQVSDATDVKEYRLYLVGLSPTPEFLASSPDVTYSETFAYPVTGVQFGVSAVSTDNVESSLATATAP
jgi:hypothetical protein